MQNRGTKQEKSSHRTSDYDELRARLLLKGYTLRSFALRHNYQIPTVYDAARGTRGGIISTRISQHLKQVAYAQ